MGEREGRILLTAKVRGSDSEHRWWYTYAIEMHRLECKNPSRYHVSGRLYVQTIAVSCMSAKVGGSPYCCYALQPPMH